MSMLFGFPFWDLDSKASACRQLRGNLRIRGFSNTGMQRPNWGNPFLPVERRTVPLGCLPSYDRVAEWKDQPPVPVFIRDKIACRKAKPLRS